MHSYIVRLAHETELAYLPEVERAAARRFLPYVEKLEISAELLEGLTPLSYLRRAQAGGRVWVAVVSSQQGQDQQGQGHQKQAQPVGFLVAKFLTTTCFVVELSVHPDYGRQGIGSALIETCCKATKIRGLRQVMLTTFRHVPWNIPFYERLGFRVLAREQLPSDIEAIVQHESRYGFLPRHRVVMRRVLASEDTDGANNAER
ncbi:MAG: GNAT family N-acetyltransferase [Cyanobacteria bacterium J06621_3]